MTGEGEARALCVDVFVVFGDGLTFLGSDIFGAGLHCSMKPRAMGAATTLGDQNRG